jgi:hypothetical protein
MQNENENEFFILKRGEKCQQNISSFLETPQKMRSGRKQFARFLR